MLVDYGRKHNFAVLATKIVCQSIRPGQVRTMVAGRLIWHGTAQNQCVRTRPPPLPSAPRSSDGAGASCRVAQGGRAVICRQIRLPRGARHGSSLPRCGELTSRASGRHRARTGNLKFGHLEGTLIPGDGAAGDQGAQNRRCQPGDGGDAMPAGCPVSTTFRRTGLRRTCRLVTARSHRPRSTWPDRTGYRSSRSRTAINGHIVFGSNNFRSPILNV